MALYYEIDYLDAGRSGSGDAIAFRYADDSNIQHIHVVDGGYADDGPRMVAHINSIYGNPAFVEHVVLTHPDGDHAAGLATVLESFRIGTLWMNRPWLYAEALLPAFQYQYTVDGLVRRLKQDFPYIADLERIAGERGITIASPLQGARIGPFTVLAPSVQRYAQLVVDSEKTPDLARKAMMEGRQFQKVARFFRSIVAGWGQENLKGDAEGTSRENESSVVQLAQLCGHKILLTGDAGVEALTEAHGYARALLVPLPGIDRFDVPHHGSRRNISTRVLDLWLGPRLALPPVQPTFWAMISANANDPDHPRKAVLRAIHHRGGAPYQVQAGGVRFPGPNAPNRAGSPLTPLGYPNEQEE